MNSFNKKCPLCGHLYFKHLYIANNYPLVKCQNCSLIFTLFSNGLENYEKIRRDIYKNKSYKDYYLSQEVVKMMTGRSKKRLKELERYLQKKGKLLDLGCSYGYFLKTAQKSGWETYGLDTNNEAIDYLKKKLNLNVFTGTIFDVKFPNNYFDAITAWDVLEHLPDLEAELGKIKELLIDKGVLALQIPNIKSLSARVAREKWPWISTPDHLFHFSPKTIKAILEKAGYKILKLKTWVNYKDFINNLFNIFYIKKPGFAYWNTLILRLAQLSSIILSPLLIPFVFLISKLLLGDLIVIYATKK